jgi:hypothetical protein
MIKAEIIAELSHLSREDLVELRAWLDHLIAEKNSSIIQSTAAVARIHSPRLANRAQIADFVKHVTEAT